MPEALARTRLFFRSIDYLPIPTCQTSSDKLILVEYQKFCICALLKISLCTARYLVQQAGPFECDHRPYLSISYLPHIPTQFESLPDTSVKCRGQCSQSGGSETCESGARIVIPLVGRCQSQ